MGVDFNLTGLSRGGQQIQKSRETYVKAVGTLVELASLQVSSPSSPLHTSTGLISDIRMMQCYSDGIHDPGRGDQGDEPTGKRDRTRRHPQVGEYRIIHQLGVGRDGQVSLKLLFECNASSG